MVDGQMLYRLSGFIDANKIHSDALPALVADVSAGERGITALTFGKSYSLLKSLKLDIRIVVVLFFICLRFFICI